MGDSLTTCCAVDILERPPATWWLQSPMAPQLHGSHRAHGRASPASCLPRSKPETCAWESTSFVDQGCLLVSAALKIVHWGHWKTNPYCDGSELSDLLFLYFCFVCLFLIEHATSEGTWNWLGKASSSPVMKSRSCFDRTVVKWFSVKCHQAEELSGAGSLRLNSLHMTMAAPIPTSSNCVF